MKTIILFMPYGSVGGMERLALTFYDFYKKEGYKVIGLKIIGLKNDIISFGEDEICLSSKDFHAYSKLGRLMFYLKIPWLLRRIVKNNRADYTISFGDMANCFSALTRTGERKIASMHALKSVEFQSKSFLNSFFKNSLYRRYHRFQKVVCISKAIKEDLLKNLNYPYDNLKVIYNPHSIKTIREKSTQELTDKFEKQLFKNNKVLLFIGRLSLQKSPWHLIKAFALLNDPSYKLVFIGDGDRKVEKYVKKLIKELGQQDNVYFLGRKENPYPYLKKAHLLCLSSLYEGTPNVIAEAIILKTPVISSLCTDGILEMMSDGSTTQKGALTITKAGIITPGFFKSSIALPEEISFTEEEKVFAVGIAYIDRHSTHFDRSLEKFYAPLTDKYKLDVVCYKYLNNVNAC